MKRRRDRARELHGRGGHRPGALLPGICPAKFPHAGLLPGFRQHLPEFLLDAGGGGGEQDRAPFEAIEDRAFRVLRSLRGFRKDHEPREPAVRPQDFGTGIMKSDERLRLGAEFFGDTGIKGDSHGMRASAVLPASPRPDRHPRQHHEAERPGAASGRRETHVQKEPPAVGKVFEQDLVSRSS